MFRSVYSKFIAAYLLFGLIGFIAVAFFSQKMTYNYLVRQNADKLYAEAVLMSSSYEDENAYLADMHTNTENSTTMVASFLNARIWIADSLGTIVLDTAGGSEGEVIPDFDPAESTSTYRIGYFSGMFDTETLSVIAPINHGYSTIGYIIIHYPMSLVTASTNEILNIVYITAVIIFILSFVILLIFTVYVYIPLRRITRGAREYAAGNLDYRIDLPPSRDEVKYLADTLNYMSSRLSDLEHAQREFISNVSHDLRSPLTSIRGYIEAILDGTIPPESHRKYLERVVRETDRLSKLSESMITLSAEDLKGHLVLTDFDINSTIRDVCNANENICAAKNISFELTFEDSREIVRADEEKIKQVLYNLIDNAIKFSDYNSVIYIHTRLGQRKVFVSVKDTGAGIPRRSIRKIWDRFYKSDSSRGLDKTGTGLGLSIVKEIIQLHNETIDVVSTEGIGTEFTFTLTPAE